MRDTDLQTSKCRRCEGTHYGSAHCPFLGEVPCVSCGRMIHEEAGSDSAVHPHRRFDVLGRVYHASCEQDVAPKKEPTLVDRLRRHAHDLTHGGTNASELRQDLETAAERILAADAYYADTAKPEPTALRACAEARPSTEQVKDEDDAVSRSETPEISQPLRSSAATVGGVSAPAPKSWTDVLCTKCGGNGVIKIPGGISQCPRCDGRCYEPDVVETL